MPWGSPDGPVVRAREQRETRRGDVAHRRDLSSNASGGGQILAYAEK